MPRSDSSETYMRAVRPKPSPADLRAWFDGRCLRGLPVLVHEVYRRVWGLRLRRTEQGLALSLLFMLPSAHLYRVGVRVVSFRSSMSHPACSVTCLWYHAGTGVSWYPSSLAVAAKRPMRCWR